MTKKEKLLLVVSSIYFLGLIALMICILLCGILDSNGILIFIIAFILYLVIGYLSVAITRMNTFEYICQHCQNHQKMNLVETLISRRGDNTRRLNCKKCSKISDMERISR